jgi:hypothetical protein
MTTIRRNRLTCRPVHVDLSVDPVIYEKARQIVSSRGDNMSNDYRRYLELLVKEYEVEKHRQTVNELLDNDKFAVVQGGGNHPDTEQPDTEDFPKLRHDKRYRS